MKLFFITLALLLAVIVQGASTVTVRPSGGGGSATNAIPLLNGTGTNTSFEGTTIVKSNLTIWGTVTVGSIVSTNAAQTNSFAGQMLFNGAVRSPSTGDSSEKFGSNAVAAGANSVAVGQGSVASNSFSLAIGSNAKALAINSSSFLGNVDSLASRGTALGFGATVVRSPDGTAVGTGATVQDGTNSTAIGRLANVSGFTNSTALGYASTVTGNHQVRLGTSAEDVSVPGTLSVAGQSIFSGNATLGVNLMTIQGFDAAGWLRVGTAFTNYGLFVLTNLAGTGSGLTIDGSGNVTRTTTVDGTQIILAPWSQDYPGYAIRPGDTLAGTAFTNTPAAGPSYNTWRVSATGTNNFLVQGILPQNYDGGTINVALKLFLGTNSSTKVSNVVTFAASKVNTALGTAIIKTNSAPALGGSTNVTASGITIAGSPVAGDAFVIQVQTWGGSVPWSYTNAVFDITGATITGTGSATAAGSLTLR